MNKICVNTRSSIKLTGTKTIYFDPLEINGTPHDADIIFITHEHYDHFSPDDISKVTNAETVVVVPETMLDMVSECNFSIQEIWGIRPFQTKEFSGIKCQGIPAYNIDKPYHPKENNWIGYLIDFDGNTFYIMGDTDITSESKLVEANVVFVPIGGKYTMDASEAASFINDKKSKCVIPIHYGSAEVVEEFIKLLKQDVNVRRFW